MKDIALVDKNFAIKTEIEREDIVFYDIDDAPFKIYGIFRENGEYRRMPEAVAKSVSEGVHMLHNHMAGGRVRFRTDSNFVSIHTEITNDHRGPHFANTGTSGFDIYDGINHVGTYRPPMDNSSEYEGTHIFPDSKMRDITINFPCYCGVKKLYIGLSENAKVEAPKPYRNEKPVVYYGSSITQGGCCSRPGRSYQNVISRRFNIDYINLGFSGNAKGEDEMIDYIRNLDMSMFVYDYDHNAPNPEHLRNTHEKMFKAIREKHPNIPIVMMSRPRYSLTPEEEERLQIIQTTFQNALDAGDENVYLLTGRELCALCGDEGTVDGCHPTDLGFFSMATALGGLMEDIIL